MNELLWLDRRGLLLLHLERLAEHGGSSGMRDQGLLDSALARPRNQFVCDQNVDVTQLAAAYGFGLARSHAFQRTSYE
jgi:death-on-curing protein